MKFSKAGHVFFCGVSLLVASSNVLAADTDKLFIGIGASLNQFDYREFDLQGGALLKESGLLPGVRFELGSSAPGFSTVFLFDYTANTIVYNGQTQGGSPLSTDTKERISDFAVLFKAKAEPIGFVEPGVSLGLGYREWRRDIQPTPITARLYETYRWKYLQVGMFAHWRINARLRIGIDASVRRPVDPTIEADIVGYDGITLELNPEDSYRVSLPIYEQVSDKTVLIIEPYWQSWNLGRSETGRLHVNGLPTASTVTEPDSETEVWGVVLRLRFE